MGKAVKKTMLLIAMLASSGMSSAADFADLGVGAAYFRSAAAKDEVSAEGEAVDRPSASFRVIGPGAGPCRKPLAFVYSGPSACPGCPASLMRVFNKAGYSARKIVPGEITSETLAQAGIF
ncbi:MAG: hypothetical protein PHV36_15130 [Elusimicrobiales bacterium]|nr:hypothetical protein [Elusimicrobiales bacterium]